MRKLYTLYKIFLFISLSILLLFISIYTYSYFSKPITINNKEGFIIYDVNNNEITNLTNKESWKKLDEISPYFINAIIAIEDKNFYSHQGFDYSRIIQAIISNIKNHKIVEGASTISQQYIKNAFLSFDKTWERKIKEAILTINLETHYSKNEILTAYVNSINYGNGNFSIGQASKYYFNKEPIELNLEEAIILAGIPKNPTNYNPKNNLTKSIKRAKVVAKAMLDNNYIDISTYNQLDFDSINVVNTIEENNNDLQSLNYYKSALMKEIKDLNILTNYDLEHKNIKIYTALNLNAQRELEKSITKYLNIEDLQTTSVIINPNTGGIMALTGGFNYNSSQYNRALYSKRQVGSTMKPFLYYAAIANGMTSSSTFLSEETTFNLANNKNYSPKNYSNRYANKEITMASAIAYSDNIYAVKTNLFLGTEKLVETAKLCGINGEMKNVPSLALGTSELNILDFANGYTTIASGGYKKNIHIIEKIIDENNNILYEYENKNDLVLNPNYVYILNELLTSTYNPAFIDYTTPTGIVVSNKLHQKYALKSGTTNTDSWTVGYNKNYLMLIWAGYDDNRDIKTTISPNVKNVWAETMENIVEGKNNWYDMPKNVVGMALNAVDGKKTTNINKSFIYYYIRGSEPYK